jgi:hypothetical protein
MGCPEKYGTDVSAVYDEFENKFADLAIYQRTWCFQEHALAKAVLHLGPRFVEWDCCTSRVFHDAYQRPAENILQ